jgi:hypothetical protein
VKKDILFTLLFLLNSLLAFTQGVLIIQDKPFFLEQKTDLAIWERLMEKPAFVHLDSSSKEFFYWTNVFRKNPRLFYKTVVVEFIRQFPEANTSDFKSLESDIKQIGDSLSFLFPDEGLSKMAIEHGKDLVKRGGVISHFSSKGLGFKERLNNAGNYNCGAENIYVGSDEPLKALISLLIDNGVKNQGHRKNLLNPDFCRMGVAYFIVGKGKTLLVQEFACK